ncbi:MFS transporter [Bisbaumannia pacifica]|uniref:MFS transporter n=1 Tax=Bisbaumannia pacifica TaxID=77098 RepID=A0ABD4L2M9_9GAMM|nr:MFS transporter [Halomonas pacifica]MBH8580216.1 MFS transporter [Halomonas pacifica]
MKIFETLTSKNILMPFAAIYGIGLAPLLVLPYLFSAYITSFSISESAAGLLVTYNLTAMCLAAFAVAPVVHRLPRRPLVLLGTALAVLGSIGVVMVNDSASVILPLLLSGIGYGVVLAVGNAVVAGYEDPEKTFDRVVLLGTVLFIALLVLTPQFASRFALDGVMLVLIALHLLCLPWLMATPEQRDLVGEGASVRPPQVGKRSYLFLLTPLSLAVLAMVLFYFIRDTMIWMYAERIGVHRLGFEPGALGFIFGVHGATSLLGPLLLIWAGKRFGRSALLMFGILASGGVTLAVSQTDSQWLYGGLVIAWSTLHFFTYSCLMGVASVADKQGRVVAAAGGAVMAANGIAPVVAGYSVEWGGYAGLGAGLVLFVGLTLISALYVIYRVSKVAEDAQDEASPQASEA